MIEQIYQVYLQSRTVTTDSRQITPGCLFFAFKGTHFDGNAYAPQALEQGAALCVISDPRYKVDDRCIVVTDVLATLQQLASHHRRQLAIPVIGITGTNGKTTTKELVHAVLSKRYRTHSTAGNFNNHLGVPLTLLSIPEQAEIAIIEMGANHPGEIASLCSIADPGFGLVTNVGRAHLEGFGSFEGVIRTKTELYRHLAAKEGTLFVNADNAILMEQSGSLAARPPMHATPIAQADGNDGANPGSSASGMRAESLSIVTYGSGSSAMTRGTIVPSGQSPYLHFYFEVGDNLYKVPTHLLGAYNFDNCMAAVAVGLHFGVEPWDIKEAIEQYTPSNRRSQYKKTERNVLILDCYNANPSSMKAALDNFRDLPMDNKIPILGGMKELGPDSQKEHEAVLAQALHGNYDQIILVGPEFEFASARPASDASSTPLRWYPDVESARDSLNLSPLSHCTILLKGSNSTRMWLLEEVL